MKKREPFSLKKQEPGERHSDTLERLHSSIHRSSKSATCSITCCTWLSALGAVRVSENELSCESAVVGATTHAGLNENKHSNINVHYMESNGGLLEFTEHPRRIGDRMSSLTFDSWAFFPASNHHDYLEHRCAAWWHFPSRLSSSTQAD